MPGACVVLGQVTGQLDDTPPWCFTLSWSVSLLDTGYIFGVFWRKCMQYYVYFFSTRSCTSYSPFLVTKAMFDCWGVFKFTCLGVELEMGWEQQSPRFYRPGLDRLLFSMCAMKDLYGPCYIPPPPPPPPPSLPLHRPHPVNFRTV